MQINHSHLVLDACCILNFYATGCFQEILKSIPVQIVVTQAVEEREILNLQQLDTESNNEENLFDLAIKEGLIKLVDFNSEEEAETFVYYSSLLGDDGESATCATAKHQGWAIATDDKKAINFSLRELPDIQILSTLEIMKHWARDKSPDAIKDALTGIKNIGNYIPPRNHPLRSWFNQYIDLSD